MAKELENIPPYNRVYVDESGINKYLHREKARSERGIKIHGAVSGLRYTRESFIAAKAGSKIFAPFCYTGTCDTKLFNLWLKDFLIPELKHGQVVIRDKATFYKSQES